MGEGNPDPPLLREPPWEMAPSITQPCDWTRVEFLFQASSETAVIACRLGHWGSIVTGVARFDDVSVVPLVGDR